MARNVLVTRGIRGLESRYLKNIHKDTPIYLDHELNDDGEMRGTEFARILSKKGYRKIFFTTSHQPDYFQEMNYISDIIGKFPPWGTKNDS